MLNEELNKIELELESFFEHENGTSVCMRERENGAGTGGAKGGWGAPTPLTPPKIF